MRGCPITYIRNYHYLLSDNSEETSSHNVWVSSNDYVFVKFLLKPENNTTVESYTQLESDLKCRDFMLSHKKNNNLFVFQGNSCSHEATCTECGQVLRTGNGTISTKDISRWCLFNL
jgi:hypothetical protein